MNSEDIKAPIDLEKQKNKNSFTDAVGENEVMVVDDKIIIKDWYVKDDFNNENVKCLVVLNFTLTI